MRRSLRALRTVALVSLPVLLSFSCMDREPAPVCPVPTELSKTQFKPGGFNGADILLVVDNSGTMQSEQEVLATSIFSLVNSLVNPLPGAEFPAADNVRFAVVSTDMGLQWGGNPYSDSDGWQGGSCPAMATGDNGAFQTYLDGKSIDLESDTIPCDGTGVQCPGSWQCSVSGEAEEGVCQAPTGNGDGQQCPSLNSTWADTTEESPNGDLAFQVACLSSLGTNGCGIEQQLEAGAKALSRSDQSEFIREDALLAVIFVSDEEDCSIEDGPGLFNSPESSGNKVNITCGENDNFLYSTDHYVQKFKGLKGGQTGSVMFAAIVGVPSGSVCEGSGDQIDGCLDHPKMQNVEYLDSSSNSYYYEPACSTSSTAASPGRRYVSIAQEFDDMGYVYSICNGDWSPAMAEIGNLITSKVKGTCYEKPLAWNPSTRQAECDVVIEFVGEKECPEEFGDDNPVIEHFEEDGEEKVRALCRLPTLPAAKDCAQIGQIPTEFGWYYCENDLNAVAANPELCRYEVQLTEETKERVRGRSISVQCMQQFTFEDENCQEDSREICQDALDNDGNGVWDCRADWDGEDPHGADPACCPMTARSDGTCEIDSRAFEICPGTSESAPSDACKAAADLLDCTLHA